jgi:hypothetical protein
VKAQDTATCPPSRLESATLPKPSALRQLGGPHNDHREFAGWWLLPTRRLAAALLLVWGLLHLVGGAIVTVIPFSFLPFVPEQDFIHYFAHFLYGLAQLPLIGVMIQQMRRLPKVGA